MLTSKFPPPPPIGGGGGSGCPEPPPSPDLPKRARRKKSVPGPEFLIIEGGFIIEFRDPNSLITGGVLICRLTLELI